MKGDGLDGLFESEDESGEPENAEAASQTFEKPTSRRGFLRGARKGLSWGLAGIVSASMGGAIGLVKGARDDMNSVDTTPFEEVNYLIIGRDSEDRGSKDRADSLTLVNVRPLEDRINIVLIPRDTRVYSIGKDSDGFEYTIKSEDESLWTVWKSVGIKNNIPWIKFLKLNISVPGVQEYLTKRAKGESVKGIVMVTKIGDKVITGTSETLGTRYEHKINYAYPTGGRDLQIKTVEDLLGIKIDGYFDIGIEELRGWHSSLGSFAKFLIGKKNGEVSNQGSGEPAMNYLRTRYDDGIERVKRHGKYISKILRKGIGLYHMLPEAPLILERILSGIMEIGKYTNIDANEMHRVGVNLKQGSTTLATYVLPGKPNGYPKTEKVSYWLHEQKPSNWKGNYLSFMLDFCKRNNKVVSTQTI